MVQQYGIKLFVIDYLQLLHSLLRAVQKTGSRRLRTSPTAIKSLAKELSVPVIVLSQLKPRVGEGQEPQAPVVGFARVRRH